jgi:tyrosine-protein kinase Etk/Wzc
MSDEVQAVGPGTLWQMLARRRRFLIRVLVVFLVGTVLLSMIMPRTYVARSTLLPPVQAARSIPGLSDLEAPLSILGMQDQSVATAKLFAQILRSRVVMEGVITSQSLIPWFRLERLPEAAAMEQAVAVLTDACDFSVSQAGIIMVSVRFATGWFAGAGGDAVTRAKAADVANAFVQQLDQINREKSLSRAKQTRLYLERQLKENEETVRTLSSELAHFQRKHGAVALDVQTKALIANASEIKSRLLAKEIELGIAGQSMTKDNPAQIRLQTEISELRKQLGGLEGTSAGPDGGSSETWMDLPAAQIPDLQYQLARYERELQAQLLLQTYLDQQYYQAKIQEASDAPTVQVLDPAIPPQERSAPKRKLMVAGGLLSGLIAGALGAALLESKAADERRKRLHGEAGSPSIS